MKTRKRLSKDQQKIPIFSEEYNVQTFSFYLLTLIHEQKRYVVSRNSLEQLQDFQGIQKLDETIGDHRLDLLIIFSYLVKFGQLVQHQLAVFLVVSVRFMRYLEKPAFLNHTIRGPAVDASGDLFAKLNDLLAQAFLSEIGHFPALEPRLVGLGHFRFKQDSAAGFADALQHLDDGAKITDMKDWKFEVDESKVTDAIGEPLAARLAVGVLLAGAHAVVQDPIRHGCSVSILRKRLYLYKPF